MNFNEKNRGPIKYWFRHEWDAVDPANKATHKKGVTDPNLSDPVSDHTAVSSGALRGGTDKAHGINRQMQWVELETGEIIDGWHASRIREFAMDLFKRFLEEKRAPMQWRNRASPNTKQEFNQKIEAAFPELRLCHAHWKAELIAIRTYPNFKTQYHDAIKAQLQPDDQDTSISPIHKRSLSLALEGPRTNAKRARTGPREAYRHPL